MNALALKCVKRNIGGLNGNVLNMDHLIQEQFLCLKRGMPT